MNTYKKLCANVFLAKCEEKHQKGDEIILTTRRGKENPSIVHNLVKEENGFFYYSITRADGFNVNERNQRKADRLEEWAASNERKSDEFYNKSNRHKDFLSLGEPIKVGHHSEKRHRRIIERAQNNMDKMVEKRKRAEEQTQEAEKWKGRTNIINLSMPESLEHFENSLMKAEKYHAFLKDNPEERPHSYALTYAKKEVNKLKKKIKLAEILWA